MTRWGLFVMKLSHAFKTDSIDTCLPKEKHRSNASMPNTRRCKTAAWPFKEGGYDMPFGLESPPSLLIIGYFVILSMAFAVLTIGCHLSLATRRKTN